MKMNPRFSDFMLATDYN